jgi:hypothetical protein
MWGSVLRKVVKNLSFRKKGRQIFSIPQIKFYHYTTAFIAYNVIGEARQPMTGKKGFHSSMRTDKTPAATGFWAAVTAVEVT